jgi:outer membrane protein TolC
MQEKQLQFELKNAYENYKTQKESVDVAKRVYNNIYNKYSQGMISSLDLTQANMNYLQAQNNYISSVMELLSSKTALDKLYNQL